VPEDVKGTFTAELKYNTDPFAVTVKKTQITVK